MSLFFVLFAFIQNEGSSSICSYNGDFDPTKGRCNCNLAWKGPACESLALKPALKNAGYRSPFGPIPSQPSLVSSWGGSVLYDETDGLWHMFSAEMVNCCGIDYWEPNSRVVHAVAEEPEGPYVYSDEVLQPFAHEPNAVRGPQGEWVIFTTMRHPDLPPGVPLPNCTPTLKNISNNNIPNTNAKVDALPPYMHHAAAVRAQKNDAPQRSTFMLHSKSPYGPWSKPVLVLAPNTSIWNNNTVLVDTNLAVVILISGEVIGIWRKCENTVGTKCEEQCCTFPHGLYASNWSNPETYTPVSPGGNSGQIFKGLKPYGSEDPMLWQDEDGIIHAILHDEQGTSRCTATGRHAFSDNEGRHWTYATADAYNGNVTWRSTNKGGNNTSTGEWDKLYRRERPHMIVSASGIPLCVRHINTIFSQYFFLLLACLYSIY